MGVGSPLPIQEVDGLVAPGGAAHRWRWEREATAVGHQAGGTIAVRQAVAGAGSRLARVGGDGEGIGVQVVRRDGDGGRGWEVEV